MADISITQQHLIERQCDMFRLAKRDHSLTAKRLAQLSRLPEPTIASWAKGTAMPAWALVVLSCYIPDDLVTMMFDPADKFVGTCDPTDGGGLAELDCEALGFATEHAEARRDGVVTPIESARLKERARRVACAARRVSSPGRRRTA
jgi:hypothetical protein